MSKKWYGSITNRLDENKMYCETIEIGTGMTEYLYTDRHAYEVVNVIDQKHVFVRELEPLPAGEPMSNQWTLVSNTNKPVKEMRFYRNHWCWVINYIKESMSKAVFVPSKIYDKVKSKGKATRYERANVSFGVAEYYFDYEF